MAGAYDRDGAGNSDAILAAARASLKDQQAGGRRVTGKPIGQRSAAIRRKHTIDWARLVTINTMVVAGMALAVYFGLTSLGLLASFAITIAGLCAIGLFWVVFTAAIDDKEPNLPSLETLRSANPKALVGQTQLWLEAQRPALPAPALDLVGRIGGQLDGLALQLDRIDEATPALTQVRALVGEQLPNLVKAYTDIPPALRKEAHAGASPDEQLTESLGKISGEIDSVTRQLAEGKLDALAIQTRYLDYKYGGGET